MRDFIWKGESINWRENEAETLVVLLKDSAARIAVEMYYGVFEDFDLITRAIRLVNERTETIRVCRCASLCLDFTRSDLDLITFNGHHLTGAAGNTKCRQCTRNIQSST